VFHRLIQDIQAAFRNPQKDPRLTVIVLSIIAVFLLFLVALLLFLLTDAPKRTEGEPTVRRRWIRRSILIGCVILAATALVAGDRFATSTSTCARCHETAAAVATWKTASHKDTACIDCHRTPGLFGIAQTRLQGLSNLADHLQGVDTTGATVVTNGTCLGCHPDVGRGTATVRGVKVRHADFLRPTTLCVDCHSDAGHGATVGSRLRLPSMNKCLPCHDGTIAGANCSLCHVRDVAAVRSLPSGYPKVHLTPQSNCGGCHSLEPCRQCHGLEMPHPAGFATAEGHGALAAFAGKQKLCYKCHQETDCRRCHQAFDAHGPDWGTRHALTPRATNLNCRDCHPGVAEAVMCDLCHTLPGQKPKPGQTPLPAGTPGVPTPGTGG
jgi:hypothetical protein